MASGRGCKHVRLQSEVFIKNKYFVDRFAFRVNDRISFACIGKQGWRGCKYLSVIFITFNMKYLSPRVCTEACRKVRVKFQRELEWRHKVYSVHDYFRLED